jgi:hypothetical protein
MKLSPLNFRRSPQEGEDSTPTKRLKIVINEEVRKTIAEELQDALTAYDATLNAPGIDEHINRESARNRVMAAAARILHHATRGRRYPLMSHRWSRE